MKHAIQAKSDAGFSFMELLVSMLILVPLMAAAMGLFSVGVNEQSSEQTSIDVNQEARYGLEMMTREIAQAGSHRDRNTVTASGVNSNPNEQSVSVTSTAGFTAGDWVDIDSESVQLTAVTANSISAVFGADHAAGAPVRLFAFPYVAGVIPPPGMGIDSMATVTTLRFYGDVTGDIASAPNDPNLYYVEYAYDSANNQITRSITPITQNGKNAAVPFIRNVKANSVQFTLNSNDLGVITSVGISMTVQNTWKVASKVQETQLSSRVLIPSAVTGSILVHEFQRYGGVNKLPPPPSQVITWASLGDIL